MPALALIDGRRRKSFRAYNSWASMVQRCTNPAFHKYGSYGGATPAIRIEDSRWRQFELFLTDMGERPKGTTLDRIDNSRGYFPGNCRWATPIQQTRNRRPVGVGYGRGVRKSEAHREKLRANLDRIRDLRSPECYQEGWRRRRAG